MFSIELSKLPVRIIRFIKLKVRIQYSLHGNSNYRDFKNKNNEWSLIRRHVWHIRYIFCQLPTIMSHGALFILDKRKYCWQDNYFVLSLRKHTNLQSQSPLRLKKGFVRAKGALNIYNLRNHPHLWLHESLNKIF